MKPVPPSIIVPLMLPIVFIAWMMDLYLFESLVLNLYPFAESTGFIVSALFWNGWAILGLKGILNLKEETTQ